MTTKPHVEDLTREQYIAIGRIVRELRPQHRDSDGNLDFRALQEAVDREIQARGIIHG